MGHGQVARVPFSLCCDRSAPLCFAEQPARRPRPPFDRLRQRFRPCDHRPNLSQLEIRFAAGRQAHRETPLFPAGNIRCTKATAAATTVCSPFPMLRGLPRADCAQSAAAMHAAAVRPLHRPPTGVPTPAGRVKSAGWRLPAHIHACSLSNQHPATIFQPP